MGVGGGVAVVVFMLVVCYCFRGWCLFVVCAVGSLGTRINIWSSDCVGWLSAMDQRGEGHLNSQGSVVSVV